jgi:hypothetical protein
MPFTSAKKLSKLPLTFPPRGSDPRQSRTA